MTSEEVESAIARVYSGEDDPKLPAAVRASIARIRERLATEGVWRAIGGYDSDGLAGLSRAWAAAVEDVFDKEVAAMTERLRADEFAEGLANG